MLARRLPLLVLLLASGAAAQDPPGLGFAFQPTPDGLRVQALADDGPASTTGLREGDVVTAVAGKSMAGLAPEAIADWLTTVGGGGIPVVLDVTHSAGTMQIQITPAPYSRAALRARMGARASSPGFDDFGSGVARDASGPGCASGDCTDGTGTWRYASGSTYSGLWRDGKRHGRGTFAFPNGMAFVGDWVDGSRVRGRETYASGGTYEGEYANDSRHGQGTYTWANGKVYTGAWQNGKRHGRGTTTYADGDTHVGLWREGVRHGSATYTFANGMTFVGEWEDDARVRGRETYESGNVYEGEYAGDTRHGQGTMTYASGNTYTGQWQDGKRHGEGVFAWPNGQRYEGTYKTDTRSGQGTMTYSDGRVFTGTWDEGSPVVGTLLKPGERAPRPVRNEGGAFVYTD
jgi:hypothetical protein